MMLANDDYLKIPSVVKTPLTEALNYITYRIDLQRHKDRELKRRLQK